MGRARDDVETDTREGSALRGRLGGLGMLTPDIARGVRAGLATLVPFYFAQALGRHELAWTALAGWLGTLADPGGARSTRAKTLVEFALVGAALLACGEIAGARPWGGLAFVGVVAFVGSMLRAVGATAGSLGTLFVVVAVIAVFGPSREPLRDGLAFASGAGIAVVMSSIVWPVWTHFPVRRAIAVPWRELASYLAAVEDAIRADVPAGDPRWATLARRHQRAVRSAVEAARAVALASRARHAGESTLGSNLRALLGLVETALVLVVALGDELEVAAERRSLPPARPSGSAPPDTGPAPPDTGQRSAPFAIGRLERLRAACLEVAVRLETARLGTAAADPRPPATSPPEATAALGLLRRLEGTAEDAVAIARAPGQSFEHLDVDAEAPKTTVVVDDLRALRDALSPASPFFRHAVRVTLAAAVATWLAPRLSPAHPTWVIVTTVVVLQPYPGATVTRGIERVVGTVFGAVVAVAIMKAMTDPIALSLAMFPLSVAAVTTRPRSYRLFTFFLTPVFVLVADHHQNDWWSAVARAGDALAGGLVALGAALTFPSRERKRLDVALRAVLAAIEAYAFLVLGGRADPVRVPLARRSVGVALAEAETSLERFLGERIHSARGKRHAETAMLLVTYVRRISASLTALDLAHARQIEAGKGGGTVLPYLRRVVEAVAAHVDGRTAPAIPPLSNDDASTLSPALLRVARRTELLASIRSAGEGDGASVRDDRTQPSSSA